MSRLLAPPWRWPWVLTSLVLALGVAAVVALAESSYRLAREALDGVEQRNALRFDIATLFRRLNQAESAQRGFLLTGRDSYLEEALLQGQHVNEALARVQGFYQSSAHEKQGALLGEAVLQKYSEIKLTTELYRAGRHDAWRSVLLTDIGREQMEAARNATQELLALEARLLQEDRRAIHRALNLGRIGAYLLTGVGLLALLLFLHKNAILHELQRAAARDLVAERDRLDAEVAHRTQELTELARYLQTVREDERAHLARELHDELGGLLTAAKLDLARLVRMHRKQQPELVERLQHMAKLIDEGIAIKRRIIEDLRPSALANLGLLPALEILTGEFAERSGLQVHTRLEPVALAGDAALAAYRLVQESLTNVIKHAQAQQVWVEIGTAADGGCEILVRDDGVGFTPTARQAGHHGLVGMRYRIESLGGRMRIRSGPGQGCTLQARLPRG